VSWQTTFLPHPPFDYAQGRLCPSPLSACRYAQAGTRGDDFLWGLHKKTPKGNPKAEFLFRGLAKDSAS